MKESPWALQGLRRLAGHRRILPVTALLLRARTVRSSLAFLARELTGSKRSHTYRLRGNGIRVAIRHGTGDVVTLGEVFHDMQYQPAPEVERQLASVGRVVDLGANVGLFGAFALGHWPDTEILAFEPDPANVALHERAMSANDFGERWQLRSAAAGSRAGQASFVAGGVALSHLADSGQSAGTIEVAVEDVVPQLAHADLVKMDIEGGEWAILADPRFQQSPPGALVLEYHPRSCPGEDPRAVAESLLHSAGLNVHSIWHRDDGHGMVWAWRS